MLEIERQRSLNGDMSASALIWKADGTLITFRNNSENLKSEPIARVADVKNIQ